MAKKLVGGTKDENGMYIAVPPKPIEPIQTLGGSVDELLSAGLQCIGGAMKAVMKDCDGIQMPSRESIQNLKDLMSMLKDLKKEEKDFLDNATDEQLERMLDK